MKIKTRRSRKVVLEMESKDSALPPVPVPEIGLKRILVPVDFSECSHKAFHYAIPFARQFNAELMLLHVIVSVPPPPQMLVLQDEEISVEQRQEAAQHLAQWRKEALKQSVKAVTRTGTAAYQEIIQAAAETNSDLIVIGNHGRTGLARLWLGGTAERVVRHAPCPVLVIRQHEHDFIAEEEQETKAAVSGTSTASVKS